MNYILLNSLIIVILVFIITFYSFDIFKPYPKNIFIYFNEPFVKFIIYLILYYISFYNPIIALLSLIIILCIHLDIINLTLNKE